MDRTLTFDLVRRYPRGATVHAAASLPLDGGPVTVLFGVSGSGKTTVLRALAGLERPDAGTIVFAGETWLDAARGVHLPPQQRRVGLVSQEPALFPHLTVAANVGYGLSALPRPEREARVRAAADRVHLPDALLSRRPSELSGGQRQRVALARALAPGPRLLLLDEPLSALDAPSRDALRGELRRFLEASGVPALLVTHDRLEALALGDRVAVMAGGTVRQVGPVAEVFASPADVEVARVVGTENVWAVRVERRSEGLAVVRSGAVELVAVDPGDVGDRAWACVRAEEIVLEEGPGAPMSARNLLSGTVVRRSDEGPLVRVVVDCGPLVVALVTRASADRLALEPGRRVAARVKAPAVRLVARPTEPA
jgi:molybdate transport system ATP-binding protein